MANTVKKIQTLLWKSYILRKSHWIVTILELCFPILLFVGLVSFNAYIAEHFKEEPAIYPKPDSEKEVRNYIESGTKVYYTPINNFTVKLMNLVNDDLFENGNNVITLQAVKSEVDIESSYKNLMLNDSSKTVIGVVFNDVERENIKFLKYKIRTPYIQTSELFSGLFDATTPDLYRDKGFLGLQMTLNKCFMKMNGKKMSSISVQKFPIPAMKSNDVRQQVLMLLSLTTIFGFIFLCPGVLKRIVEEKQSGAKELMKLMGLPSLLLWLNWFIHAMSVAIISISVITIIVGIPFKNGEPLLLCSGIVVWITLVLYCTASVVFLFLISAIFTRPTVALICGLCLWIGSYILTNFLSDHALSGCCKIISAFLPNVALSWGYRAIFHYENRDLKMSFGDVVNPSVAATDNFQLWQIWLMFVIESVLYFIVTLYFEAVFPGDFGVAKPWYFPFTDWYDRCRKITPYSDVKNGSINETDTFEPLAPSMPVGVKIRKLYKVFKSPWKKETKVAVDGLSLDICQEQITVLLGHNGAGKSTTMMILTGMIPPTCGNVHINGHNIRHNMREVRESLGLCPQHNLLFPDLTVYQHLLFFARLKGSEDQDEEIEVDFYAKKLNLIPHLGKKPQELSGGYKRRLCLALAFIGQSKIIILDEPTSGLDPEARREIWDLLLGMRGSRTILITTHIMEEADVLGDRIAIMDHGQIQCYGTPMYLKKLYGTGYVLSVLKKTDSDPEKIEEVVSHSVPGADLKSSVASLMTFSLPEGKRELFPNLFAKLQENRHNLGVESFGVSITTLEEVFLRVGEIALEEAGKNEDCLSEMSEKSECSSHPLSPPNIKGVKLLLQHLEALIIKQYRVMSYGYLILIVLSVMVMILVTVLSLHPFGGKPLPELKLDLSIYGNTTVLYENTKGAPDQFIDKYQKGIRETGSSILAVPEDDNITNALMQKGMKDKETYTFKYIVAAELGNPSLQQMVLYSDFAIHSLPISVNLMADALIKYETQDNEYGFSVSNHPFPKYEPEFLGGELVTLSWMALVPLMLTFWMAQFIVLPMQERVSASRQLQRMAGVSVPTYWITLFVWDLMMHMILSSVLIIAIVFVDRVGVFSSGIEVSTIYFILLLYGISAIPFSYFASFWKDTKAGCYSALIIVNLIAGLIMVIVLQVVHSFDVKAVDGIQAVFQLVPNFAFTQVLQNFVTQVMDEKKCLRMTSSERTRLCSYYGLYEHLNCCSCSGEDCFSPDRSYLHKNKQVLLYLGLSSILYMGLVLLLDLSIPHLVWEKCISLLGKSELSEPTGNDDVDGEAEIVEKTFDQEVSTTGNSDLLVNNLKKKYGILPKPLAVKGVSFRVKPGECFGLLGVNGAGKTTTFKMLTGAVVPTHGVAAIAGYRSDKHKSQYLSQIGYCPQQDALIECLTAAQALWFFGALRGVPRNKLNQEVGRWINMMGLREYRNKPCGTYSGGNKRKLMTAMALIGNPPLVFLDEPTSGVDPVARRNLWNSLINLQKAGQSIVLTSHSMEECEALCNRLGIMVDGQLVCMGNIPYLKNKYKQGSTIKIKLKAGCGKDSSAEVKDKISKVFKDIILKDEHETLLHYQVTNPDVSWGYLFETMENLKKVCEGLEDYTISETTLEEVFLSFAQT